MVSDDELVERMARAIFERRGWWKDDPRSWERMRQDLREQYMSDARAALQVIKDAGWKGADPLQAALTELAEAQRPLDPETATAIYANTEALYEK